MRLVIVLLHQLLTPPRLFPQQLVATSLFQTLFQQQFMLYQARKQQEQATTTATTIPNSSSSSSTGSERDMISRFMTHRTQPVVLFTSFPANTSSQSGQTNMITCSINKSQLSCWYPFPSSMLSATSFFLSLRSLSSFSSFLLPYFFYHFSHFLFTAPM
jgi:hypothetical protein